MNIPTTEEILEDIAFFDDWEERYRYIIELGKDLPNIPENELSQESLVKGCQSNVWLLASQTDNVWHFRVDSDAFIVKGLLVLVLAAYQDKTAAEISAFDIDHYFSTLDLERHLSPTRGNGLRAIVAKIQSIAANAA